MLRAVGPNILRTFTRGCATTSGYKYETIAVSKPVPHVVHAELNRPDKRNCLSEDLWREYAQFFAEASEDSECRAIVLSGRGKMFCAGIDLSSLMKLAQQVKPDADIARNSRVIEKFVVEAQAATCAIEKCSKPVITAIHNACVGAATSIVSMADIRYCTRDAWFSIKEVEVGLAPDVGVIQRVSRICGNESIVRELLYTARRFEADEAQQIGMVSRIFPTKEDCVAGAIRTAEKIASLSPVAVQATKEAILFSRDHTADEGLLLQKVRNSCLLQSEDMKKSAIAVFQKQKAEFENY